MFRLVHRIREVQAMKASARATKASAVVGLAGDRSSFSEVITCTFICGNVYYEKFEQLVYQRIT